MNPASTRILTARRSGTIGVNGGRGGIPGPGRFVRGLIEATAPPIGAGTNSIMATCTVCCARRLIIHQIVLDEQDFSHGNHYPICSMLSDTPVLGTNIIHFWSSISAIRLVGFPAINTKLLIAILGI
ncbi:hypothetical protein [Halalkalicoccus jeotgali]|uniref:hypothetical protein n=1 Tax=Halalkalicoccus jeotgali TaxID=413810 RepID=UPI00138AFE28|nr:hypothetical protein [Halalkalicoccus jeotgali]